MLSRVSENIESMLPLTCNLKIIEDITVLGALCIPGLCNSLQMSDCFDKMPECSRSHVHITVDIQMPNRIF